MEPVYDCRKRQNSIPVDELLRNVTEQRPRNSALINSLNEQTAKTTSFKRHLFLSQRTAARKGLTDKLPHMIIATESMRAIKENYEQAFMKPRNRKLTS